jgi:Family of unknown function (DUF6427)
LLKFFKTNAFFQIFSLLILLLLTRIPVFMNKMPLIISELKWQLTGEQLANGNLLYVDVLDNLGPFSAFVYAIIHFFVGRSIFAYHLVAFLITAFQMYYFTLLAHKKGLFTERNYVPGLILILFYSLSFDFFTLSPALMANTFLFLAFGAFLSQIERFGATDEVFEIGAYVGIAFLFYPPLCLFFIWILFALNLYTGASLRQQFLVIFGFVLPVVIVGIWYIIDGNFNNFYQYFLVSVLEKRQYVLNDLNGLLLTFAIPLLFGVLGFFVAIGTSRYSSFQTRAQQLISLWFMFAVISIALMPFLAPMQFIPFVLPLAYFTTLFYANYKKRQFLAEVIFLVMFCSILFVNYQAFLPSLKNNFFTNLDKVKIISNQTNTAIKNKKVLVLGNDLNPYLNNKSATPYINWALAKTEFMNLDDYSNVIDILHNFQKDPPDYIFDQENLVPKLFERIPYLGKRYTKIENELYKMK